MKRTKYFKRPTGGMAAVYARIDGVVLDALAGGVVHLVARGASPKAVVRLFMALSASDGHHPQAAELMTHLEHLTDRQIKRALLKRLRAVQQASNKQR